MMFFKMSGKRHLQRRRSS